MVFLTTFLLWKVVKTHVSIYWLFINLLNQRSLKDYYIKGLANPPNIINWAITVHELYVCMCILTTIVQNFDVKVVHGIWSFGYAKDCHCSRIYVDNGIVAIGGKQFGGKVH